MFGHQARVSVACIASLAFLLAGAPCVPTLSLAEESDSGAGYSLRLLVGFDGEPQTADDIVIGRYGTTVLLGYSSPFDMAQAYDRYLTTAKFVAIDGYVQAQGADENDEAAPQPVAPGEDALSILSAHEAEVEKDTKCRVAIIDTGYSGIREIEEKTSVLGEDGSDDNGHGTEMIRTVQNENPDATIVSIKALDTSGRGTVSGVYAGIEYAIGARADILNLSFSMRADQGCPALEAAVADAHAAGSLVVAAAGNEGEEASLFSPGGIHGVITVGACDSAGNISANSNFGEAIDVWCIAQSTSKAAARVTGWLSKDDNARDWHSSLFASGSVAYGHRSVDEEVWTIRFDAGGADGEMPEKTVAISPFSISPTPTDITTTALKQAGLAFAGWRLDAEDGSTLLIPPTQAALFDLKFDTFDGDTVTTHDLRDYARDGIITLHALWKEEDAAGIADKPISPDGEILYTLHFSSNGGTGAMENMEFTWKEGEYRECTLSRCTFTREGCEFAGWATIKPNSFNIDPVIVPDAQALVNLSYMPAYDDDVPESLRLRIGLVSYSVDDVIELSAVWRDKLTGELLGAPTIEEKPIVTADTTIYQHWDGNNSFLSPNSGAEAGYGAGSMLAIFPSSGDAVYRVMNPNWYHDYMFTDYYEMNALVAAGWQSHGTVFYQMSSSPNTPCYRFIYNPGNHNFHCWSTSTSMGGSWSRDGASALHGIPFYIDWNPSNTANGKVDVYINNSLVSSNATDYYVQWPYGTTYRFVPKPSTGYSYKVTSGSLTGTLGFGNVATNVSWTGNTYYVYYKQGSATGGWSANTYATQSRTFPAATTLRANSMTKSETNDATYTVTYNYNGSGQANTTATAYKKRTYAANGWTTTSGSTTRNYANGASFGSSSTTNLTLYPCFSQSTYNSSITAPSPTRAGYTFTGWYTAATGGTKVAGAGDSWAPGSTRTVYAHWEPDLAFSIPTEINYVVSADGSLSPRNIGIVNEGAKAIEVCKVSATSENGFEFVDNLNRETNSAFIELTLSANGDSRNLAQMSAGTDSPDPSKWRIPKGQTLSVVSSGRLNSISSVLDKQRIGAITWTMRTTE